MRLMRVAVSVILGPALGALAACGAPSHGADASRHSTESPATANRSWISGRNEVEDYTSSLAGALQSAHLNRQPGLAGAFTACSGHADGVTYSEPMVVRPAGRLTLTALGHVIAQVLQQDGWHVLDVNMSAMHLPLGSQPHPLYRFSRIPLQGAANIVPFAATGAEAIMFVNSQCFDAGAAAEALERSGTS
jgi:hypothetical protein